MYIKRNIRKRNITPAVSTAPSTTTTNRNISTATAKVPKLGKYIFPTYEEVPSGAYFSIIDYARPVKTGDGKNAIEVFYKIKNALTCLRIAQGTLPQDAENRWYYIRQRYPKFSFAYDSFKDAMLECLNLPDGQLPSLQNLPGLSEYITLGYEQYSKIGGIKARYPMSKEEFLDRCFGTYENKSENQGYEEDCEEDVENISDDCVENHNEDYDDEFDDFLEDDE